MRVSWMVRREFMASQRFFAISFDFVASRRPPPVPGEEDGQDYEARGRHRRAEPDHDVVEEHQGALGCDGS